MRGRGRLSVLQLWRGQTREHVRGEDLGLLVGPRGSTLNAIQELTRTAVAQLANGRLLFVVADGRSSRSRGLTTRALATILADRGADHVTAICLLSAPEGCRQR